jgi:hypothetical protein
MAQESLLRTCFRSPNPQGLLPPFYPLLPPSSRFSRSSNPPARLEKTRLADHEFRRNTRKAIPKSICDNSRHSVLTLPWLNELATKKQKETPLVDQTPHLGGCA